MSKATSILFDLEKDFDNKDSMSGSHFSWLVHGIRMGMGSCGCENCKVMIGLVDKKAKELHKRKPNNK